MKKRFQVVIHRTTRVEVVMDIHPDDDWADVLDDAFELAYNNEILSLDSQSTAALGAVWDVPEEEEVGERICSVCGKPMSQGYCFDGGLAYYCCKECLHQDFTDEEWEKQCDENEDSYWTEWEA